MDGESYGTAQRINSDDTDGTSQDSDQLGWGHLGIPVAGGDDCVNHLDTYPAPPPLPDIDFGRSAARLPSGTTLEWATGALPKGVMYAPPGYAGPFHAYCFCCNQGLKNNASTRQHVAGQKDSANAAKDPRSWPSRTFSGFDASTSGAFGGPSTPGTPVPSGTGILGSGVLGLPPPLTSCVCIRI